MKTVISADGTPIAYDRAGSGDPLILVGGMFSYRRFPHRSSWRSCSLLASRCTATTGAAGATAETPPRTPLTVRSKTSPR